MQATETPTAAAIVLAAGLSTRMAPRNKLLVTDPNGIAMVARVVDAILASSARPISVVVGHEAARVRAALGARPVTIVEAPAYANGLSASLRAGLAALPASTTRALICLGDMPLVGPTLLDELIAMHDPRKSRLIVVPTFQGRRGNPILWDRRFFAEMSALQGDAGARSLLSTHAAAVVEVACDDDASLTDFDTPEAFAANGAPWQLHRPPP